MRIAMVGTRGVPARYGGFETAVEEIGWRLVEAGHQVRVYTRSAEEKPPHTYRGMDVVTLPAVRSRTVETLSHTGLSAAHLVAHPVDAAFVFNAANAPWVPTIRAKGIPCAVHVDGLEWRRGKWGRRGRQYYRWAEEYSVRHADALIADAAGIAAYYKHEFDVPTRLIAYGAPILPTVPSDKLGELDLAAGEYHLAVARFEPKNHVDMIVEGYVRSTARHPLVVVGSAPYADEYTARVHAAADERVRFPGGVWDQDLLDQLYGNCLTYLHGHSVGGTNPSLLRAIGASAPSAAFDVSFNREVLRENGQYFADPDDVARCVEENEADPQAATTRGAALQERARDYDWDTIATQYEALAEDLVARRTPGPQRHARRARRS